jgi:hypothetical protein
MLGLILCELAERYEDSSIICYDQTIQQLTPNYATGWSQKVQMLQSYNRNSNTKAAKGNRFLESSSKRNNYSSRKQESELGLGLGLGF